MRVLARGKSRGSFRRRLADDAEADDHVAGQERQHPGVPTAWTPGIAATCCSSWSKNALCCPGVPYLVSGSPICAVMTLDGS